MNIEELNRLRTLFMECKNTGDFRAMSTEDMETLANHMDSAVNSLVLFPQCESTLVWLRHESNSLHTVIHHRKRRPS